MTRFDRLRASIHGWIRKRGLNWEVLGLPAMTVSVALIFSFLSPNFLTIANIGNIARQVSVLGLVAWGQTMVILTAGIDLSVGSVVALASVFAAMGMENHGAVGFILYGVGVGTAVGFVNGLLIGKLRLAPFIATLGMLTIARGIALTVTNGVPIFGLPESSVYSIGRGFVGPIPVPVIISAVGLILTWMLLYRTRFGVYVYAIGGNEVSASLAGVNVARVKMLVYTLIGFLAGVGGVVLTARVKSGQPLLGEGLELESIAAVVIGGVSLFGGRGRLAGTVWGVILIGILSNGLNLVGVSTFIQRIVIGGVIIVAVSATMIFKERE